MNDMVNTLFEYSKLGTENYKPLMEQLNLCTLVRDVITENYCEFEEHNIEPDIDISDDSITINGDKKELRRAFGNLVTNVYKHNPDGIKVKISVGRDKDKAFIKIADSGNDIPDDMDIFEPFVTENSARTAGHGTGLGLAVTKRIIERHGGNIFVEKIKDEYTKMFVIILQSVQHGK